MPPSKNRTYEIIRLFNVQHQGGFCPSDCDEVGNNRTREVRKPSQ